jgi:hypothetical protein
MVNKLDIAAIQPGRKVGFLVLSRRETKRGRSESTVLLNLTLEFCFIVRCSYCTP